MWFGLREIYIFVIYKILVRFPLSFDERNKQPANAHLTNNVETEK
jgi:hypothetical protein